MKCFWEETDGYNGQRHRVEGYVINASGKSLVVADKEGHCFLIGVEKVTVETPENKLTEFSQPVSAQRHQT